MKLSIFKGWFFSTFWYFCLLMHGLNSLAGLLSWCLWQSFEGVLLCFSFSKPKWPFYFPLSAMVFKCFLCFTDSHLTQEAPVNTECVVIVRKVTLIKMIFWGCPFIFYLWNVYRICLFCKSQRLIVLSGLGTQLLIWDFACYFHLP